MYTDLKRTWAEINLDNIEYNYRVLRKRIGDKVKFLGVIKADAYGHGAVQVARVLEEVGADYLAVSSIDEARELRYNGISMPILLLGYTPACQVRHLIANNITQAVTCEKKALEYEAEAAKLGATLKVHIQLDTGMSRLGFLCNGKHFEGGVEAICRSVMLPHLDAEGVFTHFSMADGDTEEEKQYTEEQFKLFTHVINTIEKKGFKFRIRHCGNTGGVTNYPDMYLDMVRPGLLLYGYGESSKKLGLRPIMEFKTTISTIKIYDPGTYISYGGTYKTDKRERVAVLPVGYADGLFRSLSNKWSMLTADGKAPIRGRICMDMCMIDLSDLPDIEVGDDVTIFGNGNSVEEIAECADTIPYEITCAVSKRVPRIYYRNGVVVERELRMLR